MYRSSITRIRVLENDGSRLVDKSSASKAESPTRAELRVSETRAPIQQRNHVTRDSRQCWFIPTRMCTPTHGVVHKTGFDLFVLLPRKNSLPSIAYHPSNLSPTSPAPSLRLSLKPYKARGDEAMQAD